MSETIYNKLVRDRVPRVIERDDKTPIVRKAYGDAEYRTYLVRKLVEEAQELGAADSRTARLEELADLLEVLNSLAALEEITLKEIRKKRLQKWRTRGGFDQRIILLRVVDPKT